MIGTTPLGAWFDGPAGTLWPPAIIIVEPARYVRLIATWTLVTDIAGTATRATTTTGAARRLTTLTGSVAHGR